MGKHTVYQRQEKNLFDFAIMGNIDNMQRSAVKHFHSSHNDIHNVADSKRPSEPNANYEQQDIVSDQRKGAGYHDLSSDGTFRDITHELARNLLLRAQELVSEKKNDAAKVLLEQAISESPRADDQKYIQLILTELHRYEKCIIDSKLEAPDNIDWDDVCSRPIEKFHEKFDEHPQSVFVLKALNYRPCHIFPNLVGRKVLSHQWVENNIRELYCSHITANMLLGMKVDQRVREDGILVYYRPLKPDEKLYIMNDISENRLSNIEVVYPYPILATDNKVELCCSPDGWDVDESKADELEIGEEILRQYSLNVLKKFNDTSIRVFDSACSNGLFLEALKNENPCIYTIGQDLNQLMVTYASAKVDEVHVGDVMNPKVHPESVDVVFVRFINSEIVKTHCAEAMVAPLFRCVRPGGVLVIFGHTPVLVSAAELSMVPGLEILQAVGSIKEFPGIFQYYVCRKN